MRQLLLALLVLGVSVYALLDCLRVPAAEVRGLPRAAWAVLVVLLPPVGGIAWLLLGRRRAGSTGQAGPGRGGAGPGRPSGGSGPGGRGPRPGGPRPTVGPDDDPEFLRSLAEAARRRREQEEQRRREEDPRRERPDPGKGEGTDTA